MSGSESMQILQMVDSGQVSVDDAVGLMSTVKKSQFPPDAASAERWLRLHVTNLETGKAKVQINLPLSWLRWGLTLGSRFTPELHEVDLDLLLTQLDQDIDGCILEVEDLTDNQRVEVFVD